MINYSLFKRKLSIIKIDLLANILLTIKYIEISNINQGNQTRIRNGFALIIDDSDHRKNGNFTGGVSRQYLGEIGKTDNGIVIVTSHLYDGVRSIPLDVELYQNSSSLPEGKDDKEFVKKPD